MGFIRAWDCGCEAPSPRGSRTAFVARHRKRAHKFAPTGKHKTGGMSNEKFFGESGSELRTPNGLHDSVNNHSPGARYLATGKLDSLAYPTVAALIYASRILRAPEEVGVMERMLILFISDHGLALRAASHHTSRHEISTGRLLSSAAPRSVRT